MWLGALDVVTFPNASVDTTLEGLTVKRVNMLSSSGAFMHKLLRRGEAAFSPPGRFVLLCSVGEGSLAEFLLLPHVSTPLFGEVSPEKREIISRELRGFEEATEGMKQYAKVRGLRLHLTGSAAPSELCAAAASSAAPASAEPASNST